MNKAISTTSKSSSEQVPPRSTLILGSILARSSGAAGGGSLRGSGRSGRQWSGRCAFCAVRPPGHHARPNSAMGFCFFDSIAVAARHAVDTLGVERALVVDWDVHHGNGTQEIFYEDSPVAFLSFHRFPFYPGTGRQVETGRGAGLGFTKNVPLRFGTSRQEYCAAFRSNLEGFADRVKPGLISSRRLRRPQSRSGRQSRVGIGRFRGFDDRHSGGCGYACKRSNRQRSRRGLQHLEAGRERRSPLGKAGRRVND